MKGYNKWICICLLNLQEVTNFHFIVYNSFLQHIAERKNVDKEMKVKFKDALDENTSADRLKELATTNFFPIRALVAYHQNSTPEIKELTGIPDIMRKRQQSKKESEANASTEWNAFSKSSYRSFILIYEKFVLQH